jgi:hypothetical protein
MSTRLTVMTRGVLIIIVRDFGFCAVARPKEFFKRRHSLDDGARRKAARALGLRAREDGAVAARARC